MQGFEDAKGKRAAAQAAGGRQKRRRSGGGGAGGVGLGSQSVLTVGLETIYQPKTKETRAAYEVLLSTIGSRFGDQPADVLRGAADELLLALKDESMTDPQRQSACSSLLPGLDKDGFARLVALGKRITDFAPPTEGTQADDAGGDAGDLDDDVGVAVEFEDEEDEDEDKEGLLAEIESDEDASGDDEADPATRQAGVVGDMDVGGDGGAAQDDGLPVQSIDAYWLQRELEKAFPGKQPAECQALSEEVLGALDEADAREAENKLVLLLDFSHFDLVKLLLSNRLKIVWCTRLARATSEDERNELKGQMTAAGGPLAALVEALSATHTSAKDRQRDLEAKIREEARRLRGAQGSDAAPTRAGTSGGVWHQGALKPIELDELAFSQGGQLMSNTRCELPQGSYRTTKKGYEEVHVPALKPTPFGEQEKLREIAALPSWAHPAFEGMKTLNRVQSRVCDCALFSGENMLVSAPTGAGKTNIAVMTLLHTIGSYRKEDGSINLDGFKCVYIAPMKALVAEMVGNLGHRLEAYGVKVRELTGDSSLSAAELKETQVIVCTPEKFDIVTRKANNRDFATKVKLIIIDEIHLLHDTRGPVLENVVARTIRNVESTQQMTRIVGLSATLPNYKDVGALLRVDEEKGLFFFDNSYRPCPLQLSFVGVTVRKPLQRFQLMNEITYEKVLASAGKHQVLVFVHSRKETAKTGNYLRDTAMEKDDLPRFLKEDGASREILTTEAEGVANADLRALLPHGFAIHHAGMARKDRTLVEDLFADGHVQVLVSTATLAWGVNLPAHTVIIKGTDVYNPEKGAWDNLAGMDVMQMFGRAGRPQYDTFGEGVIITGHSSLQYYLSLLNQQLPVESQLVGKLTDSLNAEVVLGTISSAQEAVDWLGYTYLYVRMLRNPVLYGIGPEALEDDKYLEAWRAALIHQAATILDQRGLVMYDRKTGELVSTSLGRVASHYYITHGTIAAFSDNMSAWMGDIEVCRLFSLAEEFKFCGVRAEEKVELARLLERVPIPVKESLDEPSAKINVLLQAHVSGMSLEGLSLMSDMVYVTQSAARLFRAMYEVALRRGWSALALRLLRFCKMVALRQWSSQSPLRQFRALPEEVLSKLERKDLAWERYYDLTSQELGELVRAAKLGRALHRLVHQFPRLELAAHVQPITRSTMRIDLTITPDFQWEDKVHGSAQSFWVMCEDADGEKILHSEYFVLRKAFREDDHNVSFIVPVTDPTPPQYFVRVVSDLWLGSEAVLPTSFRHLILPEKNPPPTELLDLQPLPVGALRNPSFERIYESRGLRHFNPIQTQVFNALYGGDDNVLVAAPAGSELIVCAEFALMRMLIATGGEGRCVYVSPVEAQVKARAARWQATIGAAAGVSVGVLTGESTADVKILDRCRVVCASPEHWDNLSRRWRQRKHVQALSLFLADEVHLLGAGDTGPAMEVVISRMRYIAAQTGNPIRVVCLGASVANGRDLGDWIGAPPSGIFAFPNGARPVPLAIRIDGFAPLSVDMRQDAMVRPTLHALDEESSASRQAIVFAPTRRYARSAATELAALLAGSAHPTRFLHCDEADLAPYLEQVEDAALKGSLEFGVAVMHEGLAPAERDVVRRLFLSGAVQVLVASAKEAWGLDLAARLVVVMGTQTSDARDPASADFPVTDVLAMLGCARTSGGGGASGCAARVMCAAPRVEYYKKFLLEPLPVESHLDLVLNDHLNAEVVCRTVENKQDAVDYLTWTFFYRRLPRNPNFYNLAGAEHRHISEHLSELIEVTLGELEASKCIAIEDDMDLSPLNLGMICAHYYVRYTTIELFASSLAAKTRTKGILEVLAAATEFDELPLRPGEDNVVQRLLTHQPLALPAAGLGVSGAKAHVLMQTHMSRTPVNPELAGDRSMVVAGAVKLLQPMVDVISSSGWLSPALAAMELSQMMVQALWAKDSPLMQLPHITREVAKRCTDAGVEGVFDLLDMEDDERNRLLDMSDAQMVDLANAANAYPSVEVEYAAPEAPVPAGEAVTVAVRLTRECEEDWAPAPVHAPHFPQPKMENWWVLVGDAANNSLLAIKRVTLKTAAKAKLTFAAPEAAGASDLTLFLMSADFMGCDQEYEFKLEVVAAEVEAGDEPPAAEE